MAKFKEFLGLNTGAKSPSSIANAEHHDKSGSSKGINVVPGSLDAIVGNSAVETAVSPNAMVRFFNTTGAVAYVWVGVEGSAPVTVDITNGYALGASQELIIAFAQPDNPAKAAAFKTSASGVQAALIES